MFSFYYGVKLRSFRSKYFQDTLAIKGQYTRITVQGWKRVNTYERKLCFPPKVFSDTPYIYQKNSTRVYTNDTGAFSYSRQVSLKIIFLYTYNENLHILQECSHSKPSYETKKNTF